MNQLKNQRIQEFNSIQHSTFKEQETQIQQQFLNKIINFEIIPTLLVLYLFRSTDQKDQNKLNNTDKDNQDFINYILDYQQFNFQGRKNFTIKKEYYVKEQQNEKILEVLNVVIQNMYDSSSNSIVFQDSFESGILLYDVLNKFQLSQEDLNQQYNENNRITFLNIISGDCISLIEQNFSKILQSFNIVIDSTDNFNYKNLFINKNCTNKCLVLQNQYFLPIKFKDQEKRGKITSEIYNLYKYILKNKIIQFNPRIIILGIEIDDLFFEMDFYFLTKIIQQLKKISQNSLIIFPMKKSNLNSENYWKTLVQCINALNYNNKIGKNITQKVKNVMKAQDYKFWVNLLSQTKKEKDFYKRQFESLNLIQKFEQQNKINLNIEVKFKFPILNQKNNIEYVILEDQENKEYIIMNSDIKYYVSYFKEDNYSKITIAIIKDSQLYWGLGNIHEIEIKNDENDKKINLDKIIYFQNNFNSSFLLDQYKFYQFNLDLNSKNQFVGTVFIYDFKGNQNLIKFQVKSDHQIISHIKGFTAIKHSDSSFSLLSGCKDGNLYQQIGIKLDLVEGNSLKLSQYKKQNSQLPKGYDYPLIVQLQKNNDQKNESTRFIYFESQTRYFAVPCISEIYQVNFQLNQFDSTCRCDKFQNVSDIHLIQNYSRLFRSDQSNIKYEIINSNAIALELVVFEQNLQRNKLEDQIYSKDIKLQKNLQCNYMHFKFIFQQQQMLLMKIKINLNESSMLFQSLNDNLNQICLYDNWLEDQNIPHIFLYNSKQHIYLLYYQKDKSGLYETKYFIFQCRKNQKECMPFDEVIINDYYNCVIWIVRKYNDRKYPYLVIYNCHWMSLQEVKEEDINRRKEVYMDKVYEINRFTEEFDLMGLEIENQNNILIIFNSKFICNVPIQLLRNQNFSLFIKQLKSGILFDEIFYFDLKFSLKTAISILNLSENKIAFFYQYCIEYCIADCIDENKVLYQIEIQGKILNIKGNNNQKLQYNSNQQNRGEYLNDENQISIKQQFNYKASSSLILARLISIQMQNQFLQSLIFLEEEYQQFYAVQLQFSLKSNETVILRMIKLKQSFGNLKILTSISTNKAETLFLCDNQIEIIRSVRSLETLQ